MLKTTQYSDLFAPLKPYLSSVVNLGSLSIVSFSGDEIPNQKEFTAMMNCSQPFVLFCIKGKISFETPYLALGIESGEFVLSVGTILKIGFGSSSSFRILMKSLRIHSRDHFATPFRMLFSARSALTPYGGLPPI